MSIQVKLFINKVVKFLISKKYKAPTIKVYFDKEVYIFEDYNFNKVELTFYKKADFIKVSNNKGNIYEFKYNLFLLHTNLDKILN